MSEVDGHPLPSPLKIDLRDNPGKVIFQTFEEVLEWANTQLQWSTAQGRNKNNHAQLAPMFDQQEAPSIKIITLANEALADQAEEKEASQQIRRELNVYATHDAVHGDSPMGHLIAGMGDGWAASGALAAALGYPPQGYSGTFNGPQLGAFAGGYVLMQSGFPMLRGKEASSVRVNLNKLHEEERLRAGERQANSDTVLAEIRESVTNLNAEAKAQQDALNALHNQYGELMKLESPAKYWQTRATESKDAAVLAAKWFGGISIVGLFAVIFILPPMLIGFKAQDGSLGAGTIGLMTAPAAIILTTLALLFRAIAGWLKDATTANERHTMIMTYIAFSGDENAPMDEEHRRHVLDRMFTPTADDNATKDAAHPYLDAIRAIRKAAKKTV